MTDCCIVCETEAVDNADWYYCEKSTEFICPWCVEDIHKIRERILLSE